MEIAAPEKPGLARGREAFARRQWSAAFDLLTAVDAESALPPADLDCLLTASYLLGRDEIADELSARAYGEWVSRDDRPRAARCAFWLGLHLLLRGEAVRGDGWFARARRLLDDGGPECVERGYLLVPIGLELLGAGDFPSALATSRTITDTSERYRDPDLQAFGRLGIGQALIAMGEIADGVSSLDEVMTAVTADEVSSMVTGIVYCAVIEACQQVLDLRRAQQWTAALGHWCAAQPDLAAYRGQCLVHRAEIMLLHGVWPDALDEATRACDRLAGQPAAGEAFYQLAEVHRLRGDVHPAEGAFRQASRWLPNPQPGLALLWLSQRRTDAAAAAIRRALTEASGNPARLRMLAAACEILIAAGDVPAARDATDELLQIAQELDTSPWVRAIALQSLGGTLLAEQDGRAALGVLRDAWLLWQSIDAPYEAARVRVQMGLACRALGDQGSAEMEFDAARWVFEQLGAGPDAARTRELMRSAGPAGSLTAREVEVLRMVATGRTNRAIATELFLSEKTVARHLSNIFAKLGVTSRAAATAYAFQHDLA